MMLKVCSTLFQCTPEWNRSETRPFSRLRKFLLSKADSSPRAESHANRRTRKRKREIDLIAHAV